MAGILGMAFYMGAGTQAQVPVLIQKEAVSLASDSFFPDLFNFVCINGFLPAAMSVCPVPMEARGGHGVPRTGVKMVAIYYVGALQDPQVL